ncbi:tetratricopeptide repeat protein [Streptomyces sp. NPDC059010]|uniref:tetratricopeptide repeat protein n=1 Tax=Streptomyces sp. NPDC059010 TaxID=3346695 RepID=UPI0036CCD003
MSHDQEALSKWQLLSLREATREFPLRIDAALAAPSSFAATAQIPRLATLLDGALLVQEELDSPRLGDLVALAMDTFLTVGAGSEYRYYTEFLADALELIQTLEGRGAAVSSHYLAAARFQAGLANGDPVRRGFIERAVSIAHPGRERLVAQLTLARFCVDTSEYSQAREVLARCENALSTDGAGFLRADFETTTGLSYYYTDPTTAREHFEKAVRLGRQGPDVPAVTQPMATALHYLGRLAAARGEHRAAIELFAEAEQCSDDYLTGHGYYHQRIAEILIDHGPADDARYHLRRAEETFALVGQRSNGYQLLQGTWARWHLRQGETVEASKILNTAITAAQRERAPRVQLVLMAELLRVRWRQHRLISMAGLLAGAVVVYLSGEVGGGVRGMARQGVTVLRMSLRFFIPQRKTATADGAETSLRSCPCGTLHEDPP